MERIDDRGAGTLITGVLGEVTDDGDFGFRGKWEEMIVVLEKDDGFLSDFLSG